MVPFSPCAIYRAWADFNYLDLLVNICYLTEHAPIV